MPRPKRSPAFRLFRALLAGIAALYFLAAGVIWYAQTKILFHPSSVVDATPADSGVKFAEVRLPFKGDHLSGWWIPWEEPGARTLLYLHGNAGNIGVNVDQVLRLRSTGLNVFIVDYRGYGHSSGGPPRAKLVCEDGERAWNYLVAERKIPPAHIAIYGHSMGGAVAIDLASKHPDAGALITEGTLTSIIDRADGTWAAYLPLRLIITERFDSLSKIGSIRLPKLILQGDSDTMVPPVMARRLYDAAPDPKQIALIPGGGHENSAVVNAPAYFAALNAFLSQYDLKPGGGAAK
jgi:pimeloyl-ACP methyl ester carboxylesterase